MEVLGSDGMHVGTVDCIKGEDLILSKNDPSSGGAHRALPLEWVTRVEKDEVRLNETAATALANRTKAEDPSGSGKPICH